MDPIKGNVAGITNPAVAQQQLLNGYTTGVQLADYFDMDFASNPMAMGFNPMDMGGSIFNMGNCGFGGLGGYGGYYGMSEKELEMRRNMTSDEYAAYRMKQSADLQKEQLRIQAEQAQQESSAKFKAAAPDNDIARKIGYLSKQVRNDEQGKIYEQYEKVLEAVKAKFDAAQYEASPDEIKAEAERLYAQSTGKVLVQDIEENGDGSFVKGLKEGVFGGVGYMLGDKTSAEDNIARISDERVSTSSQAARWTGRVLSGVVTLALAPAALILAAKGGAGAVKGSFKLVGLLAGGKKAV